MILLLLPVAMVFLVMGLVALARPPMVLAYFDVHALPAPMRNEVRAVYGGFGIAIAILLLVAWVSPLWRDGITVTVAVALLGMAAGRLVSWAVDRVLPKWPARFLLLELVMAAMLAAVAW
ncbi:DUF4345 family protein [Alloalcanivorax xenomutans]|jgi:uncharacterized protein DUF4345|uniref:DUF4345 family protein n=1 Tax=Alloalcanivorax xenomutans TaxID=1094342 RepID=UPI0003B813CD|nr:DUF4345 family protein [Alloalcanivorax xenomutans]ERS13478.1 hypothetical protein Q668_13210 [Alcanivorax sp. PN-3]CUR44592.1 hypothetical protein BN2364_0151 [Alloalcanivorax xenomutans]